METKHALITKDENGRKIPISFSFSYFFGETETGVEQPGAKMVAG